MREGNASALTQSWRQNGFDICSDSLLSQKPSHQIETCKTSARFLAIPPFASLLRFYNEHELTRECVCEVES